MFFIIQVLETFLESEFSSENIRFWIAIQDLKYSPNDQIDHKTERIYEEFLAPGAPAQVGFAWIGSAYQYNQSLCVGKRRLSNLGSDVGLFTKGDYRIDTTPCLHAFWRARIYTYG